MAITVLHELRSLAAKGDETAAGMLKASARLMGLLQLDRAQWLVWRPAGSEIDEAGIAALINERLAARAAKDFARSDEIRDELAAKGIQLKDGKDPETGAPITTWELK
jgi:cysteinyl-tRNA synthetase